jgi:hypothetical protein
MLYDWYTPDCNPLNTQASCVSGQAVGQVVNSDLQTLHQNGFNFVHLYLWDQDIIQQTLSSNPPLVQAGLDAPGFVGWDDCGTPPCGPQNSPNNQWGALSAFVSAAKANGIYVFLEFAVGRPEMEMQLGTGVSPNYAPATVGAKYANWVNAFITSVASYQNVLIWGVNYGISSPYDAAHIAFWGAAYPSISQELHQYVYSSPHGWPLLAVDANFSLNWETTAAPLGPVAPGHVSPQLGLYRWTWQKAQQEAYEWQQEAVATSSTAPDTYAFQLYNANAGDLQAALECVDGATCPASQGTCGAQCTPIPYSKMIPTEFATASSLSPQPIGNGFVAAGDQNTATTTAAGQAQWLTSTLCAMGSHNIPNTGWFGLFDTASWWEEYYDYAGANLAWHGYFGLKSEVSSFNAYGPDGAKPAWNAMNSFSSSSCSVPPSPILALQTDAAYYTISDTGTLTYTDANVTSLALNESVPGGPGASVQEYDCDFDTAMSPLGLLGSCAYIPFVASTTGTITLTLSGTNQDVDGVLQTGSSSAAAAYSVTVGLSPIVQGIYDYTNGQSCNYLTNPSCMLSVGQTDILEIFGLGFRLTGGNTVELSNQSTGWWFYETDGQYFWDDSRTQINAQLGSFVAPGVWTLQVRNPSSGTPSSGVSITVL